MSDDVLPPLPVSPPPLFHTYADWYMFRSSIATIYLEFSLGRPDDVAQRVAGIRMSPQFAKMLAILFKRHVRQYELEQGIEIPIPPGQLESLGIDLERDWNLSE
jgi:hypothetical protein